MYSRIVVPVDGSKTSDKAMQYAVNMAKHYGASITLIHVVPSIVRAYSEVPLLVPTKEFEEEGREILRKAEESIRAQGVQVKSEIVRGNPAEEILRFADGISADLIVMGSRGLSAIKAFLMGSVSHKVAAHAKCPVLIVR